MKDNTPPASPMQGGDNLLYDEDGNEMVYIGDLDDVLEEADSDNFVDDDAEDGDDELDENEINENSVVPERDDAICTFKRHTEAVFCGSLHPTECVAVTGGEDDKAFVWSTETGEVIFEVQGHKDSIISAEFSSDGIYLATADMAGEIQVFKVKQNYKKVNDFSIGDISWMKWHKAAHIIIAGSATGEIYLYRIPGGDCKVLLGNGQNCETAELTADGKKLAAGYGDGSFKLWDLKNNSPIMEIAKSENANGHNEGINCIAVDRDNNLILTGGIDGKSVLIGPSGTVGCFLPNSGSVESVLLDCPDFEIKIAVTGTLEGNVTVWDVSKQSIRVECEDNNKTGITRTVWAKNHMVVAGTLNGTIKAWDVRSGQSQFLLLGHTDNIHDLCYNKNKNILLSCSEDRTAKIFPIL